jgi:hypothetical protein
VPLPRDQHDEPVDDGKRHGSPRSWLIWKCAKSFWCSGKLYILSGAQSRFRKRFGEALSRPASQEEFGRKNGTQHRIADAIPKEFLIDSSTNQKLCTTPRVNGQHASNCGTMASIFSYQSLPVRLQIRSMRDGQGDFGFGRQRGRISIRLSSL